MQQVLVDMDGVLADVYTHLIACEYKESGTRLVRQNMYGQLEGQAFPSFDKIIREKGFFRTVPVIRHSIEGLNYLNNKYKVLIVSSATEFPDSLIEKHDWLNEFFPFISWHQMIFCGSKESVHGDIMIDDHIKNLTTFKGRKILYTQPHNMLIRDISLERVDNWEKIMKIL